MQFAELVIWAGASLMLMLMPVQAHGLYRRLRFGPQV